MTLANDHYTYRVTWLTEDGEYAGFCAEFPGLSWLADTPENALKGIREVVASVVDDMSKNGEKIPQPIAAKTFSGKFVVRIPPEIHKNLAIQSAESGISINRLVSARLSQQP